MTVAHEEEKPPTPEDIDRWGSLLSKTIYILKGTSVFFYALIMQAGVVWRYKKSFPRAATDGQNIMINGPWFEKQDQASRAGAICHEVLHIALGHRARVGNRDNKTWNIAGDISINGMIRAEFEGKSDVVKLPDNVVIREELEHLSAEEIYEILKKEQDEEEDGSDGDDEDGDDDGDDDGGDDGGDGGDDGDVEGGDGGPGGPPGKPSKKKKKGKGKGQGEADDEGDDGDDGDDAKKGKKKGKGKGKGKAMEDGDKEGEGEGEGEGEDQTEGGSVSPKDKSNHRKGHNPGCFHGDPIDPKDIPKVEGQGRAMFNRAANEAKRQGKLSARMADLIKYYLDEEQVDWRNVLYKFMVPSMNDYQGPFDRRFLHEGLFFETLEDLTVHIFICVDTSGSVGQEEMKVFLSEVQGILNLFPQLEGKGYWADADLFGPLTIEKMLSEPPLGGGGTDFRPFFHNLKKDMQEVPNGIALAVYLTDGYGEFPPEDPGYPTLWVVSPGGLPSDQFKFGDVVRLVPKR